MGDYGHTKTMTLTRMMMMMMMLLVVAAVVRKINTITIIRRHHNQTEPFSPQSHKLILTCPALCPTPGGDLFASVRGISNGGHRFLHRKP